MKRSAIILLLLFVMVPVHEAECAEYELFKEILGHPLDNYNTSLAVDNDSNVWVCSGGLVFRYNGEIWEDFTEVSGGASMVTVSPDGILWFADDGKLAQFDGLEWIDYSDSVDIPENIREMTAGPDNCLWFIAYPSIVKFNGEEFTTYSDGFLQPYLTRLYADASGGVWIIYSSSFDCMDCIGGPDGTCPKGISYFDGISFRHFTSGDGFPVSTFDLINVQWITQDKTNQNIYANCNDELFNYQNETWTKVTTDDSNGILIYGQDGKIWRGYLGKIHGNVIASLHDNGWLYFDVSEISSFILDELLWPFCKTMAVTQDGIVWMLFSTYQDTPGGLLRIDSSSLIPTHVDTEPTAFSCTVTAYPNPFNSSTTLSYSLANPGHVKLYVYNPAGQKVETLVDSYMSAGNHSAVFDGNGLASGIYFYRFESQGFEKTGRMTLVK